MIAAELYEKEYQLEKALCAIDSSQKNGWDKAVCVERHAEILAKIDINQAVKVDWFSGTTKLYNAVTLIQYLEIDVGNFEPLSGFYGYRERLYFGGISIHYDKRGEEDSEEQSVLLEMSGQGCRQYETSSPVGFGRLFSDVEHGDFRINRVDIAYDDIDKSEGRRGGVGYHWVRAELVLRDERAAGFIHELALGAPVGKLYGGLLRNYLRFIRSDSTRRERCSTVGWWDQFLDGCEAVRIFTPKDVDYNYLRVRDYVTRQAGNSIETMIQCVGVEQFLKDIRSRPSVLTPEQKRVINEYRAEIKAQCKDNGENE